MLKPNIFSSTVDYLIEKRKELIRQRESKLRLEGGEVDIRLTVDEEKNVMELNDDDLKHLDSLRKKFRDGNTNVDEAKKKLMDAFVHGTGSEIKDDLQMKTSFANLLSATLAPRAILLQLLPSQIY